MDSLTTSTPLTLQDGLRRFIIELGLDAPNQETAINATGPSVIPALGRLTTQYRRRKPDVARSL